MLKRTFDVVTSAVGLAVFSPFLGLIAILVKLESDGPILFRQVRVGKGYRYFKIIKFRTMVHDEHCNGKQITTRHDNRITRVGYWLRKLKLDELPQLWNVLIGDMSLVGPRPEVPKYVAHYQDREHLVLTVRPGITDLASIYYRDEAELLPENETENFYINRILHEKLKLNINYIYNRGFWYDIKILFFTVLISFFPAFTGKWMRASLQTSFFNQLFNSFIIRLQRMDEAVRGNGRLVLKLLIDASAIVMSYYLAFLIRFEGQIPHADWVGFLQTVPLLVLFSTTTFYFARLYRGLWQYSSIGELFRLIGIHSWAWGIFVAYVISFGIYWVPRSVLGIYWAQGVLFLGGLRMCYRILHRYTDLRFVSQTRVLVVGAGDTAEMILRQMKSYPECGYVPVGLIDDKPELRKIRIHGIPVMGTQDDISRLVFEKNIHEIIIAIPSATSAEMRKIVSKCEKTGAKLKTVPGPSEIISGNYHLKSLREVRIDDLLNREAVRIDQKQIASLITGEFVLVTGAGGSIGQELCKQIVQFHPAHLILLDRYENSLFYLENDLKNVPTKVTFSTVVADISDACKCEAVFRSFNPKIVFHAAANKHVPLMELNPEEAVKNNLAGTMNVAYLARKYRVKNFVLISTDKAVEPTSVMGASKRLAELFLQALAQENHHETKFSTVRFGNVLGSNGSVVTVFQKQIASGGPVTITDPEMTRYFMTISEAVSLILYASSMGTGGEIFVLDMGEPVKVVDMAKHLITLSGYDPEHEIPIQIVGRRPGEKLHERLWNRHEVPHSTSCEKIFMTRANGFDPHRTIALLRDINDRAHKMNREAMFELMMHLIPEYAPPNGHDVKVAKERTFKKIGPKQKLLLAPNRV